MPERIAASLSGHAKRILDSHLKVGKEKPVSYLPIKTVEDIVGISVENYRSLIEQSGNKVLVFAAGECCIKSGAVYAYNHEYLDNILTTNQKILSENGWPTTGDGFIRRIAAAWLDDKSPIMPVVKKAFGEE